LNVSLITVENISVSLGRTPILKNINFSVETGETLAIVGETGCGKSLLCKTLLNILPQSLSVSGNIRFNIADKNRIDILSSGEQTLKTIRGKEIGMVFQDVFASLNPVIKCGKQISDILTVKSKTDRQTKKSRVFSLLEMVGLSDVTRVFNSYPHQLSGGMQQRMALAIALAGEPRLLIADEPSSSLDSIAQKQYLDLLNRLKQEINLTLVLVTHDLDEAFAFADKILVLYAGYTAEYGNTADIRTAPAHPYTKALLDIYQAFRENRQPTPLPGEIPSLGNPPGGCRFHPRCYRVQPACTEQAPPKKDLSGRHYTWCFNPIE